MRYHRLVSARLKFPVLLAAVLMLGSCASNAQERPLPAAIAAQWLRDSVAYQQRLAKWLRDSTVIDSIVRSINTDSLSRLYDRMIRSEHPEVELQLIWCEGRRIGRRYGSIPMLRAEDRVRDSVQASAGQQAVDRMNHRMPARGLLSGRNCPPLEGPPPPSEHDGTPLNTQTPRPVPPRRPTP